MHNVNTLPAFELRRDRFALFNAMDSAAVNICFNMTLPDFRPWCKEQGLPPFHVMLRSVLRAVLAIDNFRYRLWQDEVIRIDRLIPSFTVVNQHGDLNFAQFDWVDDLRGFVAASVAARDEAATMTTLNMSHRFSEPRALLDQVFITCIPWLDFTSIQHPVTQLSVPHIPSLAWGKFRPGPDGTLLVPFSVQAHHGFVDGFHIHQLAEQISAELAALMDSQL
jgi:chloramphenicol O-acetyltransferase type A